MPAKNTASVVRELISPLFDGQEYELYDLEYLKEGGTWCLRIFIDKVGGVSINDCEAASRRIEKVLDEKDPIEQSYTLEVSSPGIDRPLKKDADFERHKGSLVDVRLYKPIEKTKEFRGTLEGLADGEIAIVDESGNRLAFPKAEVALVRLAVVF
ncbi:MAG: ribosome maturation factor RimP [Clostridiales bacterium]|jgi:ribosome maturation factor RimP|nr:ribosome maturation factor RimP [Clostridiales bacterium]